MSTKINQNGKIHQNVVKGDSSDFKPIILLVVWGAQKTYDVIMITLQYNLRQF